MSNSTYTIPAMRDAAENLRSQATALMAEAEIQMQQYLQDARRKAEAMRAAAAEIDADADRKQDEREGRQQAQQAAEWPCPDCGQAMVAHPLGPQHKDPYTPCATGRPAAPTIQGQALTDDPAATVQDGGAER